MQFNRHRLCPSLPPPSPQRGTSIATNTRVRKANSDVIVLATYSEASSGCTFLLRDVDHHEQKYEYATVIACTQHLITNQY